MKLDTSRVQHTHLLCRICQGDTTVLGTQKEIQPPEQIRRLPAFSPTWSWAYGWPGHTLATVLNMGARILLHMNSPDLVPEGVLDLGCSGLMPV